MKDFLAVHAPDALREPLTHRGVEARLARGIFARQILEDLLDRFAEGALETRHLERRDVLAQGPGGRKALAPGQKSMRERANCSFGREAPNGVFSRRRVCF